MGSKLLLSVYPKVKVSFRAWEGREVYIFLEVIPKVFLTSGKLTSVADRTTIGKGYCSNARDACGDDLIKIQQTLFFSCHCRLRFDIAR